MQLDLAVKSLTGSRKVVDLINRLGHCDASRDLVPYVQFKKREKDPWRSVNFSKVAG